MEFYVQFFFFNVKSIITEDREVGEKESLKIVLKVGAADAGSDVSYTHDEKKHKHKKKKKKKDKDRHRHAEVQNYKLLNAT